MEHLILAFTVVFPLFIYMLAGGVIRKAGILEVSVFKSLNGMIFKIFIPIMLFINIYQSDFTTALNVPLLFYTAASVLIVFLLLCFLVPRFVKTRRDASVMIQGIYRSNLVLFGMTIGASIYPDHDIGVIAAISAFVIPEYNILSVILFEAFRGEKANIRHAVKGILTNPLVIGGVAGIIFSLFRIPLPGLIEDTLAQMGEMASPLALICLGGMLSFTSMRGHKKKLAVTVLGRLIVVPVTCLAIGILLGYRDVELVALLAAFASPTAVASSPMAQSMGGNAELAGEIVATTSACCIITIFLLIWGLKAMGFIS